MSEALNSESEQHLILPWRNTNNKLLLFDEYSFSVPKKMHKEEYEYGYWGKKGKETRGAHSVYGRFWDNLEVLAWMALYTINSTVKPSAVTFGEWHSDHLIQFDR